MADNVIVRVPEQQFIRGEDGYSPEVTIENIDHGHSVNITDREHPEGQTFNVLDGDSAYEQAVAGGYTGTEAQFNEELRSFKALSDETKEAAPFYAEYGVTTKAEIETAINGKRQIYVHSALGMDYAPLVGTFLYLPMFGNVPQTGYRFATIEGTTQYIYDLRDEWSTSENDLSAPADRAEQAADQALIRMNSADASAQDAEAYAIGKRKGIDVGAGDPASNNNSKYYMELAAHCMAEASSSETMAASSMRNARNYASSAQDYAGQAASSASAAATAKGAAETAQGLAESAQTAAETAQGKAEDAQEAAEAVLASIPADYTELSEDVSDLKSATSEVISAVSDLAVIDLTWIDNAYINTNVGIDNVVTLTPVPNTRFSYIIAKCNPGDVITVRATGGTNPKVLSFLDADNKLLLQPSATSSVVYGTFVAPENTSKVVFNGAVAGTRIAQIGKSIKDDKLFNFNDNLIMPGKTDVGWIGNWIRPECVYFKRLREKLYFAFTSHSGAKGIGEYDFSTGLVTKRVLSRIDEADLHNDLAIHINDDGTIVAAYSTGHNTDKNVRIRRSISPECLDYFSDEIVLPCSGTTSYAQLIESSGKLYLFYRSSVLKWAYRVSTDNGITWSSETILITSDAQYYCLFVNTTTDNVIRVLSYTNPGTSPLDTNIRQSFFHTDNNTLYNSDNTTVLGTANISKANITILIANDATLTNQRLLDAAVSPIDTPYVLYAPFSTYSNAVYRLRKGASTYEIAAAGAPLITAEYFLGACFVGTEKICAICGGGANGGTDFVRLYIIGESSVSLDKVIYSEIRTSLAIRNFYPITDGTKAILWLRGVYGSTYTDFNTDAKVYLIDDEKIL